MREGSIEDEFITFHESVYEAFGAALVLSDMDHVAC